jgi:ABC-type branched-subunit amino acid transport system permease subunit
MAHLEFQTFLSLLLNGLVTASMLFIVASGLSIIFGVTQVVNFSHGSFYMLGAFLAYSATSWLPVTGMSYWLGVLAAVVIVSLIGLLIELVVLRRIYHAPEILQLLATYGVILVIQDAAKWIWGYEDLIGPRVPGLAGAVGILGVRLPSYNLFIIVLGPAILLLLWLILQKSDWGTKIRAATEDREMLGALGVNQKWLFSSVFCLGSALAGLGGALQLPRDAANLGMDFNMLTEAFVVVVIGGLGSISGAFLASLLVGVLQSFGTLILPKFTLVLIFIIMAVVLIVRPQGLAGAAQVQARAAARPLEAAPNGTGSGGALVALAALLPLLLAPVIFGEYTVALLIEMFVFILFAVSLYFLIGPGGILSFGHAAYFGLGAYAVALGAKYLNLSMVPALIAAPLAAALGALIYGWFCVRLSGVYRAMLTLAFAQITWSVAWQWIDITGGDNGILGIRPDRWAGSQAIYFYLALGICALGVLALWRVSRSPFGYALRASRDSALRAVAVGIPIRRLQWIAFILAGAVAGIAGALYAYAKGSVFPDVASIPTSVDALIMVLLGGMEHALGPVVGASIYHWLQSELIRLTDFWRAILGVVIILLVVTFPDGIAGFAARHATRVRSFFRRTPRPVDRAGAEGPS